VRHRPVLGQSAIAPSIPPHACPRQGRRRPTPRFCAAVANGTTCVSAGAPAAKLRPATRTRRRYIAARVNTAQIKSDIFTLPRCTSAELFFSDSVAALALANCNEHVAEANISQPHPPTPSVRARATGISCFPCQISARSFLRFSAPPRPFSLACSPPPGCFFVRDFSNAGGPVR
jgi:hypothetical protein